MIYFGKIRTMNDQRADSRRGAGDIVCFATVFAFIVDVHILQHQTSIFQNVNSIYNEPDKIVIAISD